MTAVPKKKYTLEEYLELDKNSGERYEYFDGEVFAMAGGSPDHARISGNAYFAIQAKLGDGDCEAFNSEMRIKVPAAFPYRYPDVSVVCGEPIFDEIGGQQMLVNPILIVEVLSPSTAAYDLGEKFTAYQSIDTFQEYLLISQDRPHVIQHVKQAKRKWLRIEIEGMESEVALESIGVTLMLAEIYRRVEFQTAETMP
jgi:Uma2 family endonuclease